MSGAVLEALVEEVQPSRLIAEALVLGHNASELKHRAQQMGLCEHLTDAMVRACCHEPRMLEMVNTDGVIPEVAR